MGVIVEEFTPGRKSLKEAGWYFEHKDDLHRMVNPSISRETLWFGTPGDAHTAARELQDIIDDSRLGTDEETAGAPPTEAEMLKAHNERLQAAAAELDEESDTKASPVDDAVENAGIDQLSFSFDYSTLDGETRRVVLERTTEIHERVDHIRRHTIQIGTSLREVKARLGYGQFDSWLRAETPFSRDTADRLIQVADYVERSPQIAESLDRFSRSALYLLVAPSTPEAAREEATERAEAGETITHAAAKEIVSKHRPARARPIEPPRETTAEVVSDQLAAETAESTEIASYAMRGANEHGVYITGVKKERIDYEGGQVELRFVCDSTDGKWRAARSVSGPILGSRNSGPVTVRGEHYGSIEYARQAEFGRARRDLAGLRECAESDNQRRKVDAALRKLDEWGQKRGLNLSSETPAEHADSLPEVAAASRRPKASNEARITANALTIAGAQIAAAAEERGVDEGLLRLLILSELEVYGTQEEFDSIARRRGLLVEENDGNLALRGLLQDASLNQLVGLLAEIHFRTSCNEYGQSSFSQDFFDMYGVKWQSVKRKAEALERQKSPAKASGPKGLIAAIESASRESELNKLVKEHKLADLSEIKPHLRAQISDALMLGRLRLTGRSPEAYIPPTLPAEIAVPMSRLEGRGMRGGDISSAVDVGLSTSHFRISRTFKHEGREFIADSRGWSSDGRVSVGANEIVPLHLYAGHVYRPDEWWKIDHDKGNSPDCGVIALYKGKGYVITGAGVEFYSIEEEVDSEAPRAKDSEARCINSDGTKHEPLPPLPKGYRRERVIFTAPKNYKGLHGWVEYDTTGQAVARYFRDRDPGSWPQALRWKTVESLDNTAAQSVTPKKAAARKKPKGASKKGEAPAEVSTSL